MNPFLILPFKGIYMRHGNEQLLCAIDARFVSRHSRSTKYFYSIYLIAFCNDFLKIRLFIFATVIVVCICMKELSKIKRINEAID